MSKKKVRNKKYRPKIVCNPLGIRDQYKTEIPFLSAIDNLGTDRLTHENILYINTYVMMMEMLDAPSSFIEPISLALESILGRYFDNGITSVTDDEQKAIKDNVPALLEFMRAQSNYDVVRVSKEFLRQIK